MTRTIIKIVLVFVAVVGGFFIWSSFRPTGVPPIDTEKNGRSISDSMSEQLSAGNYLVYQISTLVSKGTEEWPNDDIIKTSIYRLRIGDDSSKLVTEIVMDERWGGNVVSYIFGKSLIVHRYSSTGDAVVDLDGTVEEIETNWGLIRSSNGRYEVRYDSIYDEAGDEIDGLLWRDLESGKEKQLHLPQIDAENEFFSANPNHITNDGLTIYVLYLGGWEGPGPVTIWKLDVATDTLREITSFTKLTHLDFSTQSYVYSLSADRSKMLVSQMGVLESDGSEGMGGPVPAAPSTVYIVDTQTDTFQKIFTDPYFTLNPVVLSQNGKEWAHANAYDETIWIMPTENGHVRENGDFFTKGWLLEWLSDGLVVDRVGNDLVYIDRLTHDITVLGRNIGSYNDPDYQQVEYIGSIRID